MKINVTVKPGSKRGPLVEDKGDFLIIYLREKPHDGEANAALVALLAKHYNVAKSCVVIKHGEKSRQKIIEIVK